MQSFTGPELAELIAEGCIISAHPDFSAELERQLREPLVTLPERLSYPHWINSAYLIVKISGRNNRILRLNFDDQDELTRFRTQLLKAGDGPGDPDLRICLDGRWYELGVGASMHTSGSSAAARRRALAQLVAPASIALKCCDGDGTDGSEDSIVAVNLARAVPSGSFQRSCKAAAKAAAAHVAKTKGGSSVKVPMVHLLGGPCDPEDVSACIVFGNQNEGLTVCTSIEEALAIAQAQPDPAVEQGEVAGEQNGSSDQKQDISNIKPSGQTGTSSKRFSQAGQWIARIKHSLRQTFSSGDNSQMPPVLIFWGHASWSRVQLLGEIARGSWGLCRGAAGDATVAVKHPLDFYNDLQKRVAYAPLSAMTDSYIRKPVT